MKYKLVDEFGLVKRAVGTLDEAFRACKKHGWRIGWEVM